MQQPIPLTDDDLHLAATFGGLAFNQGLLNIDSPRNMFSQEALDSSLLTSSRLGHKLMVEFIIEAGAKVDIPDGQGNTPLMKCAERALVDVAEVLIMKGAEINASNVCRDTALHLSVKTSHLNGVTKCLLAQPNINVNCQNVDGETPLMIALRMLNIEAVKLLLDAGANVSDFFDKKGDNALKISESLGIGKIFDYLVNANGLSPLTKAALARDLDSLKFFIRCTNALVLESESRSENSLILFLNSIQENNNGVSETELRIIKEFVNVRIQVNKDIDDFGSLIFIASDIGNYKIIQLLCLNVAEWPYSLASNAVSRGRHDLLSLYLNHGHFLQHTSDLLELSLELEQMECAALLIQHGAMLKLLKTLETSSLNMKSKTVQFVIKHCDVHSLKEYRSDFLHIAVENGDLEVVTHLLDSGWDVNCVYNKKSPLMHALSHEMITLLLDRKADVNLKTETTMLLNALAFLYMTQIKLNNEGGEDYLGEIVNTLLSHNANVNDSDNDGLTPLMAAASLRGCKAIIEQLLAAGALSNAQDHEGRTALHHAVLNRNVKSLEVLLKNGADVNVKDQFGATPLTMAITMSCSAEILSYFSGTTPS